MNTNVDDLLEYKLIKQIEDSDYPLDDVFRVREGVEIFIQQQSVLRFIRLKNSQNEVLVETINNKFLIHTPSMFKADVIIPITTPEVFYDAEHPNDRRIQKRLN